MVQCPPCNEYRTDKFGDNFLTFSSKLSSILIEIWHQKYTRTRCATNKLLSIPRRVFAGSGGKDEMNQALECGVKVSFFPLFVIVGTNTNSIFTEFTVHHKRKGYTTIQFIVLSSDAFLAVGWGQSYSSSRSLHKTSGLQSWSRHVSGWKSSQSVSLGQTFRALHPSKNSEKKEQSQNWFRILPTRTNVSSQHCHYPIIRLIQIISTSAPHLLVYMAMVPRLIRKESYRGKWRTPENNQLDMSWNFEFHKSLFQEFFLITTFIS